MGVFQIVFLAINLAVPYWLWSRSSPEKSRDVDWTVLEKNIARLIESDEGFPGCGTLQVVDQFHELCAKSYNHFKEGNPLPVERASKQVVFSCAYSKDTIRVGWRLEENPDAELGCREPGGDVVTHEPSFSFNSAGRMRSIDFVAMDNSQQSEPYRNCRLKAAKLKSISPAPADLQSFLRRVGSVPGDPPDILTANLMCFTFDSSPLWKPWREKFQN